MAASTMHAFGQFDRAAWHRDRAADDDAAAQAEQAPTAVTGRGVDVQNLGLQKL